jgi:hypothetical protein
MPLGPFRLGASACEERDIEVFASGSIQGQILDVSNKVLRQALVHIVPFDQELPSKARQSYAVGQGKQGFFKFVHLPPGEYLILVNPEDRQDPAFPYGRTFYPGVHDRALAGIVRIRAGEQIQNADIRLERRFEPRRVIVRVTWADGRLIRASVFVSAKATGNPSAMADVRQPNARGSGFELALVPNEPYKIEADVSCRYADGRGSGPGATLRSDPVYFGAADERTELSLIIPATACPEIPGKTLLTSQ